MLDLKAWVDKVTNALKADYVVEQGTSGIWTYRKWNSGIAECWGTKTATGTFAAWGNGYSKDVAGENYPSSLFTAAPKLIARGGVTGYAALSGTQGNGTTGVGTTTFFRPSTVSGTRTFTVDYYAIGTWK